MSNLLINEPPLQVLPSLAKEMGLNESIVLQQIHYWITNKYVGKWHEGRKWVRNTVDQWQEDNFPFWSRSTINRILKKLENEGYIIADNLNKSAYDRTLWYTINYDDFSFLENPFTQNDKMDSVNLTTPIPETTTETTTEREEAAAPPPPGNTLDLWYQATGQYVNGQATAVIQEHMSPDTDVETLRQAFLLWREAKHNPANITGILDWYANLIDDPNWLPYPVIKNRKGKAPPLEDVLNVIAKYGRSKLRIARHEVPQPVMDFAEKMGGWSDLCSMTTKQLEISYYKAASNG